MRMRHLLLVTMMLALGSFAHAQTFQINKVLDNGPDGEKIVFAVVGDGYAAQDQAKFNEDLSRLVLEGVLAHDFFQQNRSAFNLYTVTAVSKDSGVSKPNAEKDTAFKTIYTGDWNRCWIEESGSTDKLLNKALSSVPKYDYVLIIGNESGFGGCRRGSRLYITAGVGWDVVAHEYGHGIGGLFDEYTVPSQPIYTGKFGFPLNARNCSTVLSKNEVIWKQFLSDTTLNIPPATVLNGSMHPNTTVGMFEGCGTFMRGIYRPVEDCRMKSNAPNFCPVCDALMRKAVAPFLSQSTANLRRIASGSMDGGSLHSVSFSTSFPTQQNQPAENNSYLQIVLRVKKNGGSEVIKVTEVNGTLASSTDPGNAAVEVSNDNQIVAATFLSEDPFIIRGFADPQSPRGELLQETDSATIIVKAPKVDLDIAAIGNSSLRLYEVQPQRNGAAATNIANDMVLLNTLKSRGLLKEQVKVGEQKLKNAVNDRRKTNSIN